MTPLPTGLLESSRADWLRLTVERLPGWCFPDKAVRLADLVLHARPMISVDLGVFGARSTLALAEGHRALGFGYVTGIDAWTVFAALEGTNSAENDKWWSERDLENIYREAMATMQRNAVLPHWQILRLASRDAVGYFSDRSIGLLHQDSNHSPEISQEELKLWIPKMVPGGIWIMDDTNWPSLKETQEILVAKYGATLHEDHDSWAVYQLP